MTHTWHALQRIWRHDRALFRQVSRSPQGPVGARRAVSMQKEDKHGHDIYISTSTNPYFNLALEHSLFRRASPSTPLLLIYRDSPCVVIGRHQNPWTEINFEKLTALGIPFLRRWSGGGAVYHDLGNSNFSIHLPRSSFNRQFTGEIVLRAVRSLGIDAHLNERNDILVGPNKMSSAYKLIQNRGYHHGTMLIATRLDALGGVLRPPQQSIVSKAVSSIRSSVANIQQFKPGITHEMFTDAIVAVFREEYKITSDVCIVNETLAEQVQQIRDDMSELSTWNCLYGQTPSFSRLLDREFEWGRATAEVRTRHGLIVDCELHIQTNGFGPEIAEMIKRNINILYQNQRYGFLNKDNSPAHQVDLAAYEKCHAELGEWLRDELQ